MSAPNNSFSIVTFFHKAFCKLASFDYDCHRQLMPGNAKAMVIARGFAVILPSVLTFGTLSLYGYELLGSIRETVLLATLFPLALFVFDFTLVAQSYTGLSNSFGMIFMRFFVLTVLIGINIFVLAGMNAGSLRAEIKEEIRESTVFSEHLIDLQFRENLNAEKQLNLLADIEESENAAKKLPELLKLRDAELYGATLKDGIQRVRGKGTKANGFILEINAVSMVVEAGRLAREKLDKALIEANELKVERQSLNTEIDRELKDRQGPGVLVSVLVKNCLAGQVDILLTSFIWIAMFVVIDCIAFGLAHFPTPQDLKQIVNHHSIINVAKSDIDHEITLQKLNSKRPVVEIKAIPDARSRYSSTQIYNMQDEAPEVSLSEEENIIEAEVTTEDERNIA